MKGPLRVDMGVLVVYHSPQYSLSKEPCLGAFPLPVTVLN